MSKIHQELLVGLTRSFYLGYVPVAAVLLMNSHYKVFYNGELISFSHHAEQRAISWIALRLGNYRAVFSRLVLLVTKEPCEVCKLSLVNLGLKYRVLRDPVYNSLVKRFFYELRKNRSTSICGRKSCHWS